MLLALKMLNVVLRVQETEAPVVMPSQSLIVRFNPTKKKATTESKVAFAPLPISLIFYFATTL